MTRVWAFQPLPELNHETGWVECEEALAQRLIEEGLVQDPAVGALELKQVQERTTQLQPHAQHTTDVVPPKGRRRARG
jgi:hypothetical protein